MRESRQLQNQKSLYAPLIDFCCATFDESKSYRSTRTEIKHGGAFGAVPLRENHRQRW
jgi:hypothetical protein